MRRTDIDMTTYWMYSSTLTKAQSLLDLERVELPPSGSWTDERVELTTLAMSRIGVAIEQCGVPIADVMAVNSMTEELADPRQLNGGGVVAAISRMVFKMTVRGVRRRVIVQRIINAVVVFNMQWGELAYAVFDDCRCDLSRPGERTVAVDYCHPDFATVVVSYLLRAARGSQ